MITAIIAIVVLFALVVLRVPIAMALFVVGFSGVWYLTGFNVANSVIHYTPLGVLLGSDVSALPLFILIGAFALSSGVAADGYKTARVWLGRLPGGLGVATIAASAAFAACSGSSVASAITMGKLAIPEMKTARYSDSLSAGICAGGGLLATMIPPSGAMVLYGLASGESISKLLMAGVIPGIIVSLFFIAAIILTAKLNPCAAPLLKETYSWKERFGALPKAMGIIFIFGTIFIGLFTGFFTPTEASAFGALAALITLAIKGKGFWKKFIAACIESAEVNGAIFFLVLGAYVFSNFLVLAGLPQAISKTIVGSGLPAVVILLGMIASFFVLGMFLESVTIMLITIPIYYPIVQSLGYSGIWFGVIVVAMIEIGMLTPPFGMVAYAVNSIAPGIGLVKVFKGSAIFVLLELSVVIMLLFFPQIALWLPSLMMK